MKKFFIFSALCTLLCFTLGFNALHAEESKVDTNKCITLTVKQGAVIKLDFAAATAGVLVKITGVKDEKEEEAPIQLHDWDKQPQYEATGTEIKVYGAIEKFTCYYNKVNITALDVSQNVNLTVLWCFDNRLSSLDVSKNVNLTKLYCNRNQLSSLDVRQNINLTSLECSENQLFSLDLSKNINLTELICSENLLSSLDVNQNVNLTRLLCERNQLSSLDVTQNVNLDYLYCSSNQLSSLDVSKNVNLTRLDCSTNQLVSLDITKNTQLESLYLYANNFSTSTLNDIYCTLPDRTGKRKGSVFLAYKKGEAVDELLAKSASKAITDGKNWAIRYYLSGDTDVEDISGNYTCGSTYGLTLAPATIQSFTYQGGEWKTTVTSMGNWKLDEATPLPNWLSVEPKEGNSGIQVTVTAKSNTVVWRRRAAIIFVLTDDANTKQVVLLSQITKPKTFIRVTPTDDYTFPYAGETKSFSVESSGAWTVSNSNAEWLTIEPKSGAAGTTTVTFKAEANNKKEERSTELTFALKDHPDIKQLVTVKQAVNPNAVEDILFAGISVAPNPFSSQLKIENREALLARYELVNTNGVIVRKGTLEGVETLLNTEELKAGVYLLRILSGIASKTLQVVKE